MRVITVAATLFDCSWDLPANADQTVTSAPEQSPDADKA